MIATLSQVCSDQTNCYNEPPKKKQKKKKKKLSRIVIERHGNDRYCQR